MTGDAAPWGAFLRPWWRIGWLSFGGPAAQVALMHAEFVERRPVVDAPRFFAALGYCNALPGPEAMQLAVWLGWRERGVAGGLLAGALFVLPGALVVGALAAAYARFGDLPVLRALLAGLSLAVLVLVAEALWRLGARILRSPLLLAMAVASAILLALHVVPFPALLVVALLVGALGGARWPRAFAGIAAPPSAMVAAPDGRAAHRAAALLAMAWPLPLLATIALAGTDSLAATTGPFFGQAALVTFGGAYAVLPHVAHAAVDTHGWLTPQQMVDGLALAETTPGPLVLVLEFVGFMAGWNAPGALPPWLAGTLMALLALWMTFVPSFALVFAGAAHVDRIAASARLRHALAALNAVVLAAIAQLAGWYGWRVLVADDAPRWTLLVALAALAAWRWRARPSTPRFVALAAAAGLLVGW
ncbi:MAG: chromate efflux transporter [Pseudomonadota bacterium]|jgi:chromate transporter